MIVSCTKCNSKYSVDDSKIKGKKFGFDCPKCGFTVEFDNRGKDEIKEMSFDDSLENNLTSDSLMNDEDLSAQIDKEIEMPTDDELGEALKDIGTDSEEDDASLNLEDLDLPDLENLGEISEEGETASDAINIPQAKSDIDLDLDLGGEDAAGKFNDDLFDDIKSNDQPRIKDADILDEFSPIEEDVLNDKDSLSGFDMDEEPSEDNESEDILSEVKSDELFAVKPASEDEDEDITIDLDSLDIQLEEDGEDGFANNIEAEEISGTVEPLLSDDVEILDIEDDNIPVKAVVKTAEDDEDITLDLDALDLTLDEVEELKEGESVDMDDERISLSDAGLTPDELIDDGNVGAVEDEDIHLHIEEVAPDVDIESSHKKHDEEFRIDEEDLPEINFEEEPETYHGIDDDSFDSMNQFKEHDTEIDNADSDIRDTVPSGMVNFSIDYSLKFSRAGAIFRLLCLFPVLLIPHFIVLIIYSVLSFILSFFNCLIILFSGIHEEDYIEIQENTIRYMLSIGACCMDVAEDFPKFAGRRDIDYSLQYSATYPIRYSRILAFLRFTVVGILLAVLPHLILLFILSIGSAVIYLIGMFSIIFRKKWPKVLFDFMIRYYRYAANVLSFTFGVIDRYPSFKFE